MNLIAIDGRLTRNPEMTTTQTGVELCKFTVANDRKKSKEEKSTSFFNCQAYGKCAAFVNTFFHKGDGIVVVGEIEVRTYDGRDGTKKTGVTLHTDKVLFPVGGKKTSNESDPTEPTEPTEPSTDSFTDVSTDDIPF